MSERFTPESVDSDVESLLSGDANGDDARLTRALAGLFPPPREADSALERVHDRVVTSFYAVADTGVEGPGGEHELEGDAKANGGALLRNGQRSHSRGSIRQMRAVLGAVAAVLVAALITGSFVLVFQSRGGPTSTTVHLLNTPTPFPTLGPSALPVPGTPAKLESHAIPADESPLGFGVDLAVSASDGTTAYDCYPVPGPESAAIGVKQQVQIWVTHDLGAHWAHAGNLPELGAGPTSCTLEVDKLDSNRLMMFLETQNPQTHRGVGEFWASTDEGATWSKIATTAPNSTVGVTPFIDQMATIGGKTYAIYEQDTPWPAALPTPTALPNQCHHCQSIAVTTHIVVSADGMHTWQPVDESLLEQVGPYHDEPQYWVQPGPEGQAILLADVAVSTAGTLPDTLWESRDSGAHWTQLPAPSSEDFEAQPSPTGHSWYICGFTLAGSLGNLPGSPGTVHRVIACSMDGGITWTPRPALRACQSCAGFDAMYAGDPYLTSDGSLVTEAPPPSCTECEPQNLYRLPAHSSQWQYLGQMPKSDLQSDALLYALAPPSSGGGSHAGGYLWGVPGGGGPGGMELNGHVSVPDNQDIVVVSAPYPGP